MLPRPHVLCYDKHGFIPWSQSTRLSREGALGPLSFISERQYIEQSTDNQQDQSAVNRTELQQQRSDGSFSRNRWVGRSARRIFRNDHAPYQGCHNSFSFISFLISISCSAWEIFPSTNMRYCSRGSVPKAPSTRDVSITISPSCLLPSFI